MNGGVDCPVCEATTDREAYPRHLATTHLGEGIQDRYAYSAVWAGVLAVLPALVLALQAYVLAGDDRVQGWLAALGMPGELSESSDYFLLVWLAVPATVFAVGWLTVAVARGPGQRWRRGYRPARKEYAYALLLPVTGIGPLCYLVGALRRFVGVRHAREKAVVALVPAAERFDQAERALAADRPDRAAAAFEDVARRLEPLAEDRHFANPGQEARIERLLRACGMAAAICEAREPAAADPDPTAA